METVEKLIANGVPYVFFDCPIIDATFCMDSSRAVPLKSIDMRPAFIEFCLVYGDRAVRVSVTANENNYIYQCVPFFSGDSYKNKKGFAQMVPVQMLRASLSGEPLWGNGNNTAIPCFFDPVKATLTPIEEGEEGGPWQVRGALLESWKPDLITAANETRVVLYRALTFLNCRNVVLKDRPQIPSVYKHYEKRNKTPRLVYKEIEVAPVSYKNAASAQHPNTQTRALHLCRGHVKTFTPEKPLFGRISGRYFWQPQMRGSKENGEVVKDYRLVTP